MSKTVFRKKSKVAKKENAGKTRKQDANILLLFFTVNNLFLFCSLKLDWNNLDSTLKTAKSISTFKFCLKNKLITDFLNSTL